ncbi:MAG TPA: R3H domain-containing nucleic acid-binding protein [Pyrinomonadaceae bacterium]|jgi:spoIIIJ-associated protein
MNETCQQAQTFLNDVFSGCQLDLSARAAESAEGCLLELDGEDASLLRSEGGELLSALEHLANQAFGRALPQGERIICDVQNFRATREAELRAMARHAAERVRTTRSAFTFGPMNSNERRIIHTSLAEETDLQTESIGEGSARRLKVTLKVAG